MRLLLRPALARDAGYERGTRFRDQGAGEIQRGGAPAAGAQQSQVAARVDHDFGRHRLLSTGGAAVQIDPRHSGSAAGSPPAGDADYEELVAGAGYRYSRPD